MNSLSICQEILFKWIAIKKNVSYDTLLRRCEYLNEQYNLNIEKHPAQKILFPLFYMGNIELCHDKIFRATEPVLLYKDGTYLYTNISNQDKKHKTDFPLVYISPSLPNYDFNVRYYFNAVSILNNFPSIDKIVNSFDTLPLNDFSQLFFENKNMQYGIAKSENIYKKWYFIYPATRRIVSIPSWTTNPDALNIAYCYDRTIKNYTNGTYNSEKELLKIKKIHFPIMLYRILIVESLLNKANPNEDYNYYIFPHINKCIVKELNRILCKSIKYE